MIELYDTSVHVFRQVGQRQGSLDAASCIRAPSRHLISLEQSLTEGVDDASEDRRIELGS